MSNKNALSSLKGFRLANFQSFDESGAMVIDPSQFNIFVGPNNVGKSKLIRSFKRLETDDNGDLLASDGKKFQLYIYEGIDQDTASSYWRLNLNLFSDEKSFGDYFEKVFFEYEMMDNQNAPRAKFIGLYDANENKTLSSGQLTDINERFQRSRTIHRRFNSFPIPRTKFFYIGAERDVLPESAENSVRAIKPNGQRTTTLIRKFLLSQKEDTDLVRRDMLNELNEILSPDYSFTDIRCQELESGLWEIFLSTEKYGEIALSQSGSGLKTVLQLLANTQLVASSGNNTIDSGLFLFEER